MKKFILDEVDLNQNIVIEASAGTGKTFTLESIVCRLISLGFYSITDLLVITFTKKAANELRERIRLKLVEERLKSPFGSKERYSFDKAIIDFNESSISTIHSFCHSIYNTYAFDMKIPFTCTVDDTLYLKNLRRLLRDSFQYLDSDKLSYLENIGLESFFYQYPDIDELINNLTTTVDYLDILQGNETVKVYPGKVEAEELEHLEQEFNQKKGGLYNAWVQLTGYFWLEDLFDARKNGKVKIVISGVSKGYLFDIFQQLNEVKNFRQLMETLCDYRENQLKSLKALSCFSSYSIYQNNDNIADLSEWEHFHRVEAVDNFLEEFSFLYDKLKPDANIYRALTRTLFLLRLRSHLEPKLNKLIKEDGLLSFDSSIEIIYRTIKSGNQALIKKLQSRYSIVLVDEFQDTDTRQWQIINMIFGQDDKHNYILVGDPKQSIYRFRGANLNVYKDAIKSAQQYYLGDNYRSTSGLINAYNFLFSKLWKNHYQPVEKGNKEIDELYLNQEVQCSIEWLHITDPREELFRKDQALSKCFRAFRDKISELLRDNYTLGEDRVRPKDIAIIVDKNQDAVDLQVLLNQWDIPAVVTKRNSLFHSEEANLIAFILKAITYPKEYNFLKRLLYTPLFPFSLEEIDTLIEANFLDELSFRFSALKKETDNFQLVTALEQVITLSSLAVT